MHDKMKAATEFCQSIEENHENEK